MKKVDLNLPTDLRSLEVQLDEAEHDAHSLVADLSEEQGAWRASADSWSVSQCLDHLTASSRVYLEVMQPIIGRARELGKLRRRPALPGPLGRWLVSKIEPPVKGFVRAKAPTSIQPRGDLPLSEAFGGYLKSHDEVRRFLRENADLDLASIRFSNPFVKGLRFSVATGLYIIPAHERRHLWQAWRVRRREIG
ncbi:MAG TPA: DinB family protein [Terriglobales bacterium]|nr:DinB family protein [Terriglobales bacterium]